MEMLLAFGLILVIGAIFLWTLGAHLVRTTDQTGVFFCIFGLLLLALSIFLIINSTEISVKKQTLNFMIETKEVGVKILENGDMEYVLVDSSKQKLFDYLIFDLQQKMEK